MPAYEYTTAAISHGLMGRKSGEVDRAELEKLLNEHGADAAPGRRFGSPEALALYRLNALDASVKGALEHGLA